eukprot:TRINITY_DN64520_c0_g1_i1.p1 TRINITY_DN64520_c0_g1~~TRINITY_DN64520_c0_g1_i1.p1  ORF type:complete len:112 (+),score=29.22 TRINITY_DN64520_c0_g1_i1:95-430(+)
MTLEGLRATLKKYRDSGRISSKLYQDFYGQAKGGTFKSEKAMLEQLHKSLAEEQKVNMAEAKTQAAKNKAAARRQSELEARQAATASQDTGADIQEDDLSEGEGWQTGSRR